jgi:hypothetical protein
MCNPTALLIGQLLAAEKLVLEEMRALKHSLPYSDTRKSIEVIIEVTEQMIQYAKTNETRFLPIQQLLQRYLHPAHRMAVRYDDAQRSAGPDDWSTYAFKQLEAEIDRLRTGFVAEYRAYLTKEPIFKQEISS